MDYGTRAKPPITVEPTAPGPREAAPVGTESLPSTFQELSKHFEFFTPALMMTKGGFDRDPLTEYVISYSPNDEATPNILDHDEAFFANMGHTAINGDFVEWDRRIYVIPRQHWQALRDFISSIAWSNPADKSFTRVHFREHEILDPIASKRGGVLTKAPTFPVTVFGVSSTKAFVYLSMPVNPFEKPVPIIEPPRPDVAVEGKALMENLDPNVLRYRRGR